jgi:hypothetical protein
MVSAHTMRAEGSRMPSVSTGRSSNRYQVACSASPGTYFSYGTCLSVAHPSRWVSQNGFGGNPSTPAGRERETSGLRAAGSRSRWLEVGELQVGPGATEHRSRQVPVGRSGVPHLGAGVGHRSLAQHNLHFDLHRAVRHGGDNGGDQQPQRLLVTTQLGGHGPGGQCVDHSALE